MPGLSQLKQFSNDLLSLGDEVSIRASRGEKPVIVTIPKEVEDIDDSEDFVLGMPEIENEAETLPVDEDLSDLVGLASGSTNSNNDNSEPAPSFEAPDLSSLLNPINIDDDASAGADMPDLSMFEDQPEEEIVPEEPEPEEISIADMGLEALLSGGGFDEPEEEAVEETPSEPLHEKDFKEVTDLDSIGEEIEDLDEPEPVEELSEPDDGLTEIERDLLASIGSSPAETKSENESADLAGLDLPDETLETPEDLESFDLPEEPAEVADTPTDLESFDLPEEPFESSDAAADLESFDLPEEPAEVTDAPADLESFDLPEEPIEASDTTTDLENFDLPEDTSEVSDISDFNAPLDIPEESAETTDASGDFDLADLGGDLESFDLPEEPAEASDAPADLESFDLPEETTEVTDAPADLDSFDLPEEPAETGESSLESFGLDDFGIGDSAKEVTEAASEESSTDEVSENPFSMDDIEENSETQDSSSDFGDFSLDDMDFGSPSDTNVSFSAEEEIPDYEDSENSNLDTDGLDGGEGAPLEVFDTSEMEGMDFGIPDTDSQLNGDGSGDFEFGNNDDFAMEGEFEIPGFSDVDTAKEEKSKSSLVTNKHGKGKNLPEPDFSDAAEGEDLPPNTLSDAQYKQFLKNLSEYPLNVRLAFEDLIVQDEFTDDAEFEVIEKILNKAPARQVASMLEKMLDISIPVPRDYEHRTAEEYEAYKKSLAYQLKNKIIPGILVGIVLMFVAIGIYNFSKNCIYKPLKANKLYKQGYALLQEDEYPQSEMKFEEAVSYRINKKWFFNYARGYREHKQYQRAGSMYERILKYFKHDKVAGLEYADMELNDLANYERAEEIVRREVLDYHINDADGILKLGDVFLEWGTEKDPDKLENAREQYATLIQLYKANDLYLSRMMRYFIRTDNLRQVIQMQKTFEPREKALGSEDLTELSGYLLDKYYGPLAPSDEYLRYEIEGLRGLLARAVKADPNNPIALYNLSKFFIKSGETAGIESTLQSSIEKFNTIQSMKKRDIYKYIDAYRLLGEHYISTTDYLQAQEQFAEGISLYTTERDNAGFAGTPEIGKLYEDMGNIKYSISGDYDDALLNYKYSVELENDNPSIRYRIGYIQYKNKNYAEALGSFMKSGDGNVKERNLLLAMANTLSLRGDDYAAEGYYNQLIDSLDREIAKRGLVFPQASVKDYDIVNTYLSASNNYGVTLYRLAKRTGNSGLNAQAIVQFQQSLRAWDAMTRNQATLVRLGGSNLAEQNIQYITHTIPEFEPSIYTDISKTLTDSERL